MPCDPPSCGAFYGHDQSPGGELAVAGVRQAPPAMKSEVSLWMRAPASAIYPLAAEVERWPEWLPHYRWVRLLERSDDHKLVEMAASRDGIPVSWRALQTLFPEVPRIEFRHVRGVTKGMAVAWTFQPQEGGTLVRIEHRLDLGWPLIGPWIADHIIGRGFVENIAGKTLRRVKQLAEVGLELPGTAGSEAGR
jgi:ribosome-associated toxin RatA of RatAB toxin-antitoxin module